MLNSFRVFYRVIVDNGQIFLILLFAMMVMWLFCSTLMFYAERENPDESMSRPVLPRFLPRLRSLPPR